MKADSSQDVHRLRRRLKAFVSQARENEHKLQRFLQQEMAFMAADGLGELLDTLFNDYPQRFDLDAVSLRLADPDHEIRRILAELEHPTPPQLLFVEQPLPPDICPRLGPLEPAALAEHFPGVAGIASAALLPLWRQHHCLGQLAIGSRRSERFIRGTASDFLSRLAAVLAVCIENALNHERVRRLGLIDPLTGLHNRRYFDARLAEEIGQARRSSQPLSCLILDIDHFKQVNDHHGHAAGDVVLKRLADVLKQQMRLNDVLARLGGEEFAVLLGGTDPAMAMDIAERIRLAVSHAPCDTGNESPVPITVSIGCSSLQAEMVNQDAEKELLEAADAALYAAKHGGRNRVNYQAMHKKG